MTVQWQENAAPRKLGRPICLKRSENPFCYARRNLVVPTSFQDQQRSRTVEFLNIRQDKSLVSCANILAPRAKNRRKGHEIDSTQGFFGHPPLARRFPSGAPSQGYAAMKGKRINTLKAKKPATEEIAGFYIDWGG